MQEVRATVVRVGAAMPGTRLVPVEAPLAIEVNGAVVAHVMRTPGNDVELAVGFCRTEGLIGGMAEVASVQVCPDDAGRVSVRTVHETEARMPLTLTSACAGERLPNEAELPEPLASMGPVVEPAHLVEMVGRLQKSQSVRREAGAVHAAAIFSQTGELIVAREDVGRHNAIDKAVGQCVYLGCDLGVGVLVSTGRASSEMVLKATRSGIPIAASRSGATSLGVELSERLGLTLVSYLRSAQMTVLTHPHRVSGASLPRGGGREE